MIVIDANILIYSLIESDKSPLAQKLREKDPDWRTVSLCLHETLNVLATYLRRGLLSHSQARELLARTERFVEIAQSPLKMEAVLDIAVQHNLSGYDAQYIALARELGAPLITEDRKLRDASRGLAISMQEFVA